MFARDRSGTAGTTSLPYNETLSQGRNREEEPTSHLTKPLFKDDPLKTGNVSRPREERDDKEGNLKRLKREKLLEIVVIFIHVI